MASLSIGFTNFPTIVYENPAALVLDLATQMKKFEVAPEIEIFDPSHNHGAKAVDRSRPGFTDAARAIREHCRRVDRKVGLLAGDVLPRRGPRSVFEQPSLVPLARRFEVRISNTRRSATPSVSTTRIVSGVC